MKKLKIVLFSLLLTAACAFTSYAMSVKVTFSDPTAELGQEFDVTMKITSESQSPIGEGKLTLSYDPGYLEFVEGTHASGGAGTLVLTGGSDLGTAEWKYSLKFKALQAGSTSISIADKEVYDEAGAACEISHAGSSSVTISGEAGSSVNANLSSLKISPGVLEPAFSPENTSYKAVVGGDVEKIMVSAPAADQNAKVVISGNADLQLGENTVECKVTAADGATTKSYVILVTKQEGEVDYGGGLLTATVNGIDFEVMESFDETLLPEGYTQTTYNYKGTNVQAGVREGSEMILMYLLGGDGSGDLYLYDEKNDAWAPFATINVAEKFITIVPLPEGTELPEGFSGTTIELNGKKVRGWVWATDEEQKYCIVYGMNADGEKDFYRYDMKEKTIQRYFRDPAVEKPDNTEELTELQDQIDDLNSKLKTQKMLVYVFAIIAGVLLIGLIIVLLMTRSKPEDDDYDDEDEVDEDNSEEVESRTSAANRQTSYTPQASAPQETVRTMPTPSVPAGGYGFRPASTDEDIQKVLAQDVREVGKVTAPTPQTQAEPMTQTTVIPTPAAQTVPTPAPQRVSEPQSQVQSNDDDFETFEL